MSGPTPHPGNPLAQTFGEYVMKPAVVLRAALTQPRLRFVPLIVAALGLAGFLFFGFAPAGSVDGFEAGSLFLPKDWSDTLSGYLLGDVYLDALHDLRMGQVAPLIGCLLLMLVGLAAAAIGAWCHVFTSGMMGSLLASIPAGAVAPMYAQYARDFGHSYAPDPKDPVGNALNVGIGRYAIEYWCSPLVDANVAAGGVDADLRSSAQSLLTNWIGKVFLVMNGTKLTNDGHIVPLASAIHAVLPGRPTGGAPAGTVAALTHGRPAWCPDCGAQHPGVGRFCPACGCDVAGALAKLTGAVPVVPAVPVTPVTPVTPTVPPAATVPPAVAVAPAPVTPSVPSPEDAEAAPVEGTAEETVAEATPDEAVADAVDPGETVAEAAPSVAVTDDAVAAAASAAPAGASTRPDAATVADATAPQVTPADDADTTPDAGDRGAPSDGGAADGAAPDTAPAGPKFCGSCGAPATPGAETCASCGQPLLRSTTPDVPGAAPAVDMPASSVQAGVSDTATVPPVPPAPKTPPVPPIPPVPPVPPTAATPAPAKKRFGLIVGVCVAAIALVVGGGAGVWFIYNQTKAPKIEDISSPALREQAEQSDLDGDGRLSSEEAGAVSELDLDLAGETSLSEVGSVFPKAESVTVTNAEMLTQADFSDLPGLVSLDLEAAYNLSNLDVANNSKLQQLDVADETTVSGLDAIGLKEVWNLVEINAFGDIGAGEATRVERTDDGTHPITVTQVVGASTYTYEYTWDGTHITRIDQTSDSYGAGSKNTYTFEWEGDHIVRSTVAGDLVQEFLYTYDEDGHLTKLVQQNPDGTPFQTSTYTYDSKGNLITEAVTDMDMPQPSTEKTYTWNDDGTCLVASTEKSFGNDMGTTTYTCDEAGNLVSITDPSGDTETASYDEMGLLEEYTAYGETIEISRDPAGRVMYIGDIALTWERSFLGKDAASPVVGAEAAFTIGAMPNAGASLPLYGKMTPTATPQFTTLLGPTMQAVKTQ